MHKYALFHTIKYTLILHRPSMGLSIEFVQCVILQNCITLPAFMHMLWHAYINMSAYTKVYASMRMYMHAYALYVS